MAKKANAHKQISKMMDEHNPYRDQQQVAKGLTRKWKKTGLLDGIENEYETAGMAVLLENQARQLIDEASKTGTSANSEEWSGVALPLVRKVFGEIAAKDFVSVQPMNLPSGLVFFLNFKYGTAQPGFAVGDQIHGTTNAAADASGGLYGAGRFGYSINEAATAAIAYGSCTDAAATWDEVNFDPALSASVAASSPAKLRSVIVPLGVTDADLEGARAWKIAASVGAHITAYYPAHTSVDSSYNAKFFVIGTTLAGGTVTVTYHKAPADVSRGDFEEATVGTDVGIPEVDVSLNSEAIVAKTRKLKAIWTPEFAQDLNAYHSIDAEAELTSMLSEYISMEIDLEILDMLIKNALTTEYWSAKVGFEYDGAGGAESDWAEVSGASNAYTKGDWYQTLGIKMQKVSNKIHQKTLRGGANFAVCGPDVATAIESIPGYASDSDGDSASFAMGVQKIGMLNNRWTVYKNPYMLQDTILMGFRGAAFLETGAVYAPYVPLIMTPLVYDPTNFTPRKGVMTRYAKKMVRPEFYGKVVVAHSNHI